MTSALQRLSRVIGVPLFLGGTLLLRAMAAEPAGHAPEKAHEKPSVAHEEPAAKTAAAHGAPAAKKAESPAPTAAHDAPKAGHGSAEPNHDAPVPSPVAPERKPSVTDNPYLSGAPSRVPIGTNLVVPKVEKKDLTTDDLQRRLEIARKLRIEKDFPNAEKNLMEVMRSSNAPEFQRPALLELAYLAQDTREYSKAQQLYAEYVKKYQQDPTIPEVVLKQGRLYRDMGAPDLAVSKFYAVMSTALNLKLGDMEYYQLLVLQAQTEIAETRFQEGKYSEAEDFLERLLKLDNPQLNRALILSKLVRALSAQQKRPETISEARRFLATYPNSSDAAEIRFLLAEALKKSGQNHAAMQEVLVLLQSEEQHSAMDPLAWQQWRERAGNDIANQLYQEGDYVNALAVYTSLAQLNGLPEWQISVWYQMGLIYERLKQPSKAIEVYNQITGHPVVKDLPKQTKSLASVVEMANWRRDHLRWSTNAELVSFQLQLPPPLQDSEKKEPDPKETESKETPK